MIKTMIIGNLTANPESRIVNVENGQMTVCNFTVATDRYVKGSKAVSYFRISCWNRQAENAMKYLRTGSMVYVCGVVSAHPYKSKNGELRASLELSAEEIQYLSSRQENTGTEQIPPPAAADADGFMNIPDGVDGELPFA